MALTPRSTHRDLAYFFLGLIIAFSISGIFLNHRQSWNPRRYTYAVKEIQLPAMLKEQVTDSFVTAFTASQQIDDVLRRFSVDDKNALRISYTMNDVTVDLATGAGKIESYRTTPLLGQMTKLHIDTSKWWIYYSDVFDHCPHRDVYREGKEQFLAQGLVAGSAGYGLPADIPVSAVLIYCKKGYSLGYQEPNLWH
jgi:hypothetical protein